MHVRRGTQAAALRPRPRCPVPRPGQLCCQPLRRRRPARSSSTRWLTCAPAPRASRRPRRARHGSEAAGEHHGHATRATVGRALRRASSSARPPPAARRSPRVMQVARRNAAMRAATTGPTSGTCFNAFVGFDQRLQRAEISRQRLRRAFAHVADAEREQQRVRAWYRDSHRWRKRGFPPIWSRSCRRDGLRHDAAALVGALFGRDQVVDRQRVQVGDGAHAADSTSSMIRRSPGPSMSIARREAKWNSASPLRRAEQPAGAASPRLRLPLRSMYGTTQSGQAIRQLVRARIEGRRRIGQRRLSSTRSPSGSRRRRGARSRCRRRTSSRATWSA